MLNGNISNSGVKVIAFRVEDTLIKKHGGIWGKWYVDENARAMVDHTYRKADYFSVCLVVGRDIPKACKKLLDVLLEELGYTSANVIDRDIVITTRLRNRTYYYYVDDNEERASFIGTSACLSSREFNKTIKY